MNWVDQVKDVFLYTLKLELHKNKGRQLGNILKKMSKDSGIPYGVLGVWNQEKKYGSAAGLFCRNCGQFPVRINHRGKPYGPKSVLFGLCASCINRGHMNTKGGKENVKKR